MTSRAFLNLVARVVNVDASTYPNDSKLEQKLIYELKTNAGDSVKASGTLTSTGTAPANNDTVTIGGYTYTFKTALTSSTAPFEVLIGASASVALDNLKSAINATAGGGTTYGSRTTAHPDVIAGAKTATTLVVTANLSGTAGNAIVTTDVSAQLSWGAGTLTAGANGTYYKGQSATDNAKISGGQNI